MDQAILQFFEGLRTPALSWVFGIITMCGEAVTVAGVILLLYWLIGGSLGEQLLFTALTSAAFNSMLKCAVHRPRPYAAGVVAKHPDTPIFTTEGLGDNLSFPSGHAQATSSALFTGAMRAKRRVLGWIFAVLLILLVCCSRMYLGVHFPTDVLAGVLFGLAIAVFWQLIFKRFYSHRYFVLIGLALLALFLVPFAPEKEYVRMAGLLTGGAFFLPLTAFLKYDVPKKFARRLWRIPVGLLCAGVVFAATYFFPEHIAFTLLKWFLLVGAGTLLATLCFKILKI